MTLESCSLSGTGFWGRERHITNYYGQKCWNVHNLKYSRPIIIIIDETMKQTRKNINMLSLGGT